MSFVDNPHQTTAENNLVVTSYLDLPVYINVILSFQGTLPSSHIYLNTSEEQIGINGEYMISIKNNSSLIDNNMSLSIVKNDAIGIINVVDDSYNTIIEIIKTLPAAEIVLIMLLLAMIAFYATSFDSIALIASYYSYRTIPSGKIPNKIIEFMWCILLILLPIALVFSSSSMNNLQSVSIIAAFPLGIVIILIAISLIKELQQFSCKDN